MKTHLQIAQETHAVSKSYFDNRLRDYVQNTLEDTLLDRYENADDENGLVFRIDSDHAIAFDSDNRKFYAIYCSPLCEICDYSEFKNSVTVVLTDSDDDYLKFEMPFDFSKLSLCASADAAYFVATLEAFLAASKVTVRPDTFEIRSAAAVPVTEKRTELTLTIESLSEDLQQLNAELLDRAQSACLSDSQLQQIKLALSRAIKSVSAVK